MVFYLFNTHHIITALIQETQTLTYQISTYTNKMEERILFISPDDYNDIFFTYNSLLFLYEAIRRSKHNIIKKIYVHLLIGFFSFNCVIFYFKCNLIIIFGLKCITYVLLKRKNELINKNEMIA